MKRGFVAAISLVFLLSACGSQPGIKIAGCPEDAQLCPDGSSVTRNPDLDCAFDPCPKEQIACPQDAKQCPGGSFVSRNPNINCDFDPCPKDQGVCPGDVKECPDGKFVSRNPNLNCAFDPCPVESPACTTKVDCREWAEEYDIAHPLCLVVALAEFITWLVIQYLALTSFGYMDFGVGLLVLLFLAVGVLLYGLSLLHGASNHLFARVYQWWTAFYLLAFTYLLSFQIVLAFLGVGVSFSEFTTKAGMFFIATAIIALISFFIGWGAAKNAKQINTKEITWFIGIVFALIILTFTPHALAFTEAYAISETEEGGSCWAVSCYDSTTEAGCIKNTDALSCIWTPGRCFEGSCSDLSPDISSEESCAANKNCVWERNTCNEISCRDLGETTCDVAKGCIWEKGESDRPYCRWLSCERYTTAKECSFDTFNLECKWENNWCQDLYCRDMKSENACLSKSCLWEEQSFCEVDQEALDNKGDLANTECMGYKNKNTCEGVNHCMWSEFGSSGFGLDPGYGLFGEGEMTGRAWFVWIFSNLIFLTLILIIISYGTLHKLPRIINLGIFFFTIDIIARYIGFIMDFSGYTSLSIIFITGGILLIFGGWGIEKWRRNLIAKTK